MRSCSRCREEVPLSLFGKDKRRKDGLASHCKPCDRLGTAKWREENRKAHNKMCIDWNGRNKDKRVINAAKFNKENRAKRTAQEGKRRAMKLQATPSWLDEEEIVYIYELARERDLVVDHIVPLNSKLVCGLHTGDNLRCIPAALNLRKSNVYWPDMPVGG